MNAIQPDIHLALVSNQAVPNITPALDPTSRPRAVTLLVSPDMHQQAEWLTDVLRTTGIEVSHWPIADAWDIQHIRDRVLDWMAAHEEERVALNATGGTKPMSIAAYEAFRAMDQPIFYVHPERDRLIWMHPAELPAFDLADKIRLPQFLQAHGATLKRQGSDFGVPESRRRLTETLVRYVKNFEQPLRTLNWAAATAERSLVSEPISRASLDHPDWRKLIDLFAAEETLTLEQNRLHFHDEAARFYANGGWLEDHVYGLCLSLKRSTPIHDVGRSLEVERQGRNDTIPNELDVAFLADNRLYIIECKTARFDQAGREPGKGADILYKLDTLTDLLGGLQARSMVVSYQQFHDYDRQRAADLRIRVCCGGDLSELPAKIKRWVS